jgi:hypothetical protein
MSMAQALHQMITVTLAQIGNTTLYTAQQVADALDRAHLVFHKTSSVRNCSKARRTTSERRRRSWRAARSNFWASSASILSVSCRSM